MNFPKWRHNKNRNDVSIPSHILKNALGIKPADRKLKKILFDNLDDFFIPLDANKLSKNPQTYSNYTIYLKDSLAYEVVPRRTYIYILPLYNNPNDQSKQLVILKLAKYLSSFLPNIQACKYTDFRPPNTRFFKLPDGTIDTQKFCPTLIDMVKRLNLNGSIINIVVTDIFQSNRSILSVTDGVIIVNINSFLLLSNHMQKQQPQHSNYSYQQQSRHPQHANYPYQQQQQLSYSNQNNRNIFASSTSNVRKTSNPFATSSFATSSNNNVNNVDMSKNNTMNNNNERFDMLRLYKIIGREICFLFGMKECCYYKCLLNEISNNLTVKDIPGIMCIICLRKLLYKCGLQANAIKRYQALLSCYNECDDADGEVDWLNERIHVISL